MQQQQSPTFTVTPHGILMDGMPLAKSARQCVPECSQGHLRKAEEYFAQVKPADWNDRTPYAFGKESPLVMAHLHASLASPQPWPLQQKPLAKAGFNPDEPRDERGRWTDEGAAPASRDTAYGELEPAAYISSPDISSSQGKVIVEAASKWEGTPYAPAGTEHQGAAAVMGTAADCSGSVYAIYSGAGFPYNYTQTSDFARMANTGEIPFRKLGDNEEPQPGDVVLYHGHMSIYAGDDSVWSARKPGYPFDNYPVDYFKDFLGYYRYQQTSSRSGATT